MLDEFDAYDFSEFTDEDFAAIDAHLARVSAARPTIQITLEPTSPFHKFLFWKKHFAVTDLVSPVWCEVQYEYGLYGKRHKPLRLRPSTFSSRNGNQIRVHQQVALANDRRLKRGKSVHKALEDELRPDKLVVHVVSGEERFGLRLLRLIDGFNELISNGITRELPVFTITHAQVVIGVIDEVLRSPPTQTSQDQVTSPGSPLSSFPGSSPKKKQRMQKTNAPVQNSPIGEPGINAHHAGEPTEETTQPASTCISGDPFEFRIIDYKTRRSSTTPLDEDSLSPRLQLMMYHRMLSSLLQPEAFDFDSLWSRLNLDPTKPFSTQFSRDIAWEQREVDPTDGNVHLDRLVSEWISTVQRHRLGLTAVSQQLQIVYRRSVFVEKKGGEHKVTETVDVDDPLQALVLQEELDLACAIEKSLSEMGHEEVSQVANQVARNVKQAGPSSAIWKDLTTPLGATQTDPMLAWGIQQSLLTCAHKVQAEVRADETQTDDGSSVDGSTVDISPIIGTKVFRMDDVELDTHLADVLEWWLGARPARGVEVGQTNRCFTCEYQDSCEWREKKAREADGGRRLG